ncbi:MAG: nitroreductase [Caldiserica bacterium CG02_land_8_20_14_3_00_36_38]|jgi:nitroreductase|nr:nitroreductase [Caldisericota bacterium]OIP12961.1 MAG: nitroreductase [Caldisericum sp. CG2_30_36_11]PIP49669.1 MAG: nitroreductase [Caldiserica bacterium CG23_combo_of_CG06-09_8_20_14_all_35_60]PIV56120.1 MAG: nitroreductase [Caldiserica bacterium CG02_land_8_20_14_3_00_36_38]PIW11054.1 MAG: nitroreductase [Caldiserica bacterium CG17_big_fil_post_rev_8_21_14_2_50_35_7]PIX29335.1 MAG: nitroreductase [Caldiserica bacterium CG_4_8_14_3_um_filter_35_18]
MILEEILKRKSVRSYLDKPVKEEKLNEVLEAGRLAPSACNIQPWKFIVVKGKKRREKLAIACKNQKFVGEVPVIIAACIVSKGYNMGGWYDSAVLDIGIAFDHMTLQAVHLGLGTCWIGAFKENKVKKILEIPDEIKVAALLTLGYPKDPTEVKKNRKPIEEIVSYKKYT